MPEKVIEEFTGLASGGEERVSVARMRSPAGWRKAGQCPEFDEYTVVLSGVLRVEMNEGTLHVGPHQAALVRSGEWAGYLTPGEAEYMPVFSPGTVNRN